MIGNRKEGLQSTVTACSDWTKSNLARHETAKSFQKRTEYCTTGSLSQSCFQAPSGCSEMQHKWLYISLSYRTRTCFTRVFHVLCRHVWLNLGCEYCCPSSSGHTPDDGETSMCDFLACHGRHGHRLPWILLWQPANIDIVHLDV